MTLISFFSGELAWRVVFLLACLIIISSVLVIFPKEMISIILRPLTNYSIEQTNLKSNLEHETCNSTKFDTLAVINNTENFVPSTEINLPIFTSINFYLWYILILSLILTSPIAIYQAILAFKPVLTKREGLNFCVQCFFHTTFIPLSFYLNHCWLIPGLMKFTFSHFYEYSLYEFDVVFEIQKYLNVYVTSWIVIKVIYCLQYVKYNLNYASTILRAFASFKVFFIMVLFFTPPSLTVQISYIFSFWLVETYCLFQHKIKKNIIKNRSKGHSLKP